jgi:putative endonuclease
MSTPIEPQWQVYIILTKRQRLYTGITNDMRGRWQSHLDGKGAKFFRIDKPAHIVYLENGHDRSSASKRESAIKQLSRAQKLTLISIDNPKLTAIDLHPAP